MDNTDINTLPEGLEYGSDAVITLDWKEHIRRRPGMYIGKLGDGSHSDDGIYVLLKEVLDNAIDEYMMGFGKHLFEKYINTIIRGCAITKFPDIHTRTTTYMLLPFKRYDIILAVVYNCIIFFDW